MPIVSFRVDRETYEALKKKASEEGVTVSDLLRFMVKENLGIEIKSDIERRLEELEKRVQELEKLIKQQSGIQWFMKKR